MKKIVIQLTKQPPDSPLSGLYVLSISYGGVELMMRTLLKPDELPTMLVVNRPPQPPLRISVEVDDWWRLTLQKKGGEK